MLNLNLETSLPAIKDVARNGSEKLLFVSTCDTDIKMISVCKNSLLDRLWAWVLGYSSDKEHVFYAINRIDSEVPNKEDLFCSSGNRTINSINFIRDRMNKNAVKKTQEKARYSSDDLKSSIRSIIRSPSNTPPQSPKNFLKHYSTFI